MGELLPSTPPTRHLHYFSEEKMSEREREREGEREREREREIKPPQRVRLSLERSMIGVITQEKILLKNKVFCQLMAFSKTDPTLQIRGLV